MLDDTHKDLLTMRIATVPGHPYFDATVPAVDQFVPPNFYLGQFFFTKKTANELVRALDGYSNPCCLCTPRLAYEWFSRGRRVTLLDIDPRFGKLEFADYIRYDFTTPTSLDRNFDVIIVDPPGFLLEEVHHAITVLVAGSKPDLFLVFEAKQENELLQLFADYGLSRTDYDLEHSNVLPDHRHDYRLYTNKSELPAHSQAIRILGLSK